MCSNAGKTVGTGSAMDLEVKRCMDVAEDAAPAVLGEDHQ